LHLAYYNTRKTYTADTSSSFVIDVTVTDPSLPWTIVSGGTLNAGSNTTDFTSSYYSLMLYQKVPFVPQPTLKGCPYYYQFQKDKCTDLSPFIDLWQQSNGCREAECPVCPTMRAVDINAKRLMHLSLTREANSSNYSDCSSSRGEVNQYLEKEVRFTSPVLTEDPPSDSDSSSEEEDVAKRFVRILDKEKKEKRKEEKEKRKSLG